MSRATAEEVLMWVVAGVLIGLVVLASLVSLHTRLPYAHLLAAGVGLLAAGWFVLMVADGRSAPILWALLTAALVVTTGLAVMAWNGWKHASSDGPPVQHLSSIESAEGVAVSDLADEGIVRVHGEEWTAVSVNGRVSAGSRVQVLRAAGVHLEVWGEEAQPTAPERRG